MDSKENPAISNGEVAMRDLTISGHIDDNGKLKIANDPEYKEFLMDNKNSTVSIKLQALSNKDAKISQWYYGYVVLPKMQEGLRKVGYDFMLEEVKIFMSDNCPLYWNDPVRDTKWYNAVIEWCKRYAAENLDTIIKD